MKAPNFSLSDQNGKSHSLSGYKGKWIIIYFYPKDFTPGCTKEACGFRDKGSEKYNLNFSLLSDPEHKVIEAYGAWAKKKFMGREYYGILRSTFIINPKGEIVKEYKNVNPLIHSSEILEDLTRLSPQKNS